ncbi:MAG: hypothetical protein Q8M94_02255, partial [Ignavibacteria bacterium]|nr:hypothetical protein [Ignavibacteria bacterium]
MKRNNLLTTTEKYSLIAIISIPFGALLIALLQQNMEIFTSSTFFIAYFIFICFSLPSLLSKVVFKQKFFSLTSVLCFLYFPLIYIFGLITHHLYGVDFQDYYFGYGIATILLW